jgi:hypothetical protein
LVDLVNTIVERLPDEKKYGFAREVRDEHVSPKAETTVKRGFWNAVKAAAYNIFIDIAPTVIEAAAKWVLKSIPTLLRTVL